MLLTRDNYVRLPKMEERVFCVLIQDSKEKKMSTLLPRDANNVPLPAMRMRNDCAHSITTTSNSARNVSAFNPLTKVISLYATGPVHLRFGSSSVTATSSDHYFPGGIYYDIAIGGDDTGQYSHVAVISANYDCQLFISEKQ